MSDRNFSQQDIDAIRAAGFKVYGNPDPQHRSYLYFTDDVRIGYIYISLGMLELSTVHIPNMVVGTGFRISGDVSYSRKSLEKAFAVAPHWADSYLLKRVRKYKNFEEFQAKHYMPLVEVI